MNNVAHCPPTSVKLLVLLIVCILGLFCTVGAQNDNLQFLRSTYCHTANNYGWSNPKLAVDQQGYVYLTGCATDAPTTPGSYRPTKPSSAFNVFVAKFSPDLTTLVYCTYIGGNAYDGPTDIAVNSAGEVTICGCSKSTDFPYTNSADQQYMSSSTRWVFVCRLNASGSQLIYSRLLGSSTGGSYYMSMPFGPAAYPSLCLNSQGDAYVLSPASTVFTITANAYQSSMSGGTDMVLTKIDNSGSISYSSYVGGSGDDDMRALYYANGRIYLSARTKSANFPLATGKSADASGDCAVMAWNDSAVPTPVVTYVFGSSGADDCYDMAYHSSSNRLYIVGMAGAGTMPYNYVLQSGQTSGAFLACLDASLSGISYLTMLGSTMYPVECTVRSDASVAVVGTNVNSSTLSVPTTSNALNTTPTGLFDSWLLVLQPSGDGIRYGTYLGGSSFDYGASVVMSEGGPCSYRIHVGVASNSGNFPVGSGGFQSVRAETVRPQIAIALFGLTHSDSINVQAGTNCGEYYFTGVSTACTPLNFIWNFGDGSPVIRSNPVAHSFKRNGTFTVSLRVAYPGGDTSICSTIVKVTAFPEMRVSPATIYRCLKDPPSQINVTGCTRVEWHPGTALSDSTIVNPKVSPNSNTKYYVRGYNAGGCYVDDSLQVYVTRLSAALNTRDTVVCAGSSVNLKASGGSGYKWSPSTGLNLSNVAEVIATPKITTEYTVVVSDGSCYDTARTRVTVVNKPTLSLSPAPIVCTGSSVTLEAKVSGSELDTAQLVYSWTPSTSLNDASLPNPTATPQKTTTYTCVVRNKYGCIVTKNVTVTVQNSLDVRTSFSDTLTCVGSSLTLTASGAAQYTWVPSTFLDNPHSATPRCTPTQKTRYMVLGTSGTCSDSTFVDVDVYTMVPVRALASAGEICPGSAVRLYIDTSLLNCQYEWRDQQGNVLGTSKVLEINPIQTNTYSVVVRSLQGCSVSDSIRVVVNPLLQIKAQGSATVLPGTKVVLRVIQPKPDIHYEWIDEAHSIIATTDSVEITATASGRYVVHAQRNGCEGFDTLIITVTNFIPVVASADTSICAGEEVTCSVLNASANASIEWLDEQGTILGTGKTIDRKPAKSCIIIAHAVEGSSESRDTVTITVYARPTVVVSDTSCCPGAAIVCRALSDDANASYAWFDESQFQVSSQSSLSISPTKSATYTVRARNAHGCTGESRIQIHVQPQVEVTLSTENIDSAKAGTWIEIPVYAQASEDLSIDTLRFELGIHSSVLQIEQARRVGRELLVDVQKATTLGTSRTIIARIKALVLANQNGDTWWRIINPSSNLDTHCVRFKGNGGLLSVLSVCSNDLQRIELISESIALTPNPVLHDEFLLNSDEVLNEVLVVDERGILHFRQTSLIDEGSTYQSLLQTTKPRYIYRISTRSLANGVYVVRAVSDTSVHYIHVAVFR